MAKSKSYSPLGLRIKARLTAMNDGKRGKEYTLGKLASACDVTPQAVTKWLDEGTISREKAKAAAKYLRTTVDWLVGQSELSDEAIEMALNWALLDERQRDRWKHTIQAAADVAREQLAEQKAAKKEIHPTKGVKR